MAWKLGCLVLEHTYLTFYRNWVEAPNWQKIPWSGADVNAFWFFLSGCWLKPNGFLFCLQGLRPKSAKNKAESDLFLGLPHEFRSRPVTFCQVRPSQMCGRMLAGQ